MIACIPLIQLVLPMQSAGILLKMLLHVPLHVVQQDNVQVHG